MKRIHWIALVPLLSLASCTTLMGLLGDSGESKPKAPPVPADRKAPVTLYGESMLRVVRDCIGRGDLLEARFLVQDLEAAGLPEAQTRELAGLRAQVDKGYRPDVESSLSNGDVLVAAKDFNGKYGYIDATGRFAIPARFVEAAEFSEGLALVREAKDQPQCFIDRDGGKVLEIKPTIERYFYDQGKKTVWMVRDGVDSQVPYDGSFDIPLSRIQIEAKGGFHDGLARCELRCYKVEMKGAYTQGRQGTIYIDRTGRERLFFPTSMFWISDADHDCDDFSGGLARVLRKKKGERLYGYVDTTGRWIQEPAFAYAGSFFDGMAAVMYPNTDKWGFLDASGKVALKPFYQSKNVECFQDGILVGEDGIEGKFLLLGRDGRVRASFPSKATAGADSMDQAKGIAARSGDGVVLVAWRKGTVSVQGNADDVVESVIGVDGTGRELFAVSGWSGQRVFVNSVEPFSNGRAFVMVRDQARMKELWGVLDTRGNWVVAPTDAWTPAGAFRNGLARVRMTATGAVVFLDRAGKPAYQE